LPSIVEKQLSLVELQHVDLAAFGPAALLEATTTRLTSGPYVNFGAVQKPYLKLFFPVVQRPMCIAAVVLSLRPLLK
jgi:hypothetical protein